MLFRKYRVGDEVILEEWGYLYRGVVRSIKKESESCYLVYYFAQYDVENHTYCFKYFVREETDCSIFPITKSLEEVFAGTHLKEEKC